MKFHSLSMPCFLSFVLSASYMWMESDAINIDGMVRLYRGDGVSPDDWSDSSGTGGALLLEASGQAFVFESPYAAAGGTDRLVYSFDATNGCARTTDSTGLPSGAQPRTIMGWINHRGFPEGNSVPFGYGTMKAAQAFNVFNNPNEISFDWAYGGDESFTNFYTASDGFKLNAWFHVAITYDGKDMRAYVNGAKKREVNDMTPNTQL